MALIKKQMVSLLLSCFCYACTYNNQPPELQQEPSTILPNRAEAISFFSRMHTLFRDTERATYDALFGIRDGFDSFVYDAQKDYYKNYQK